MAMPFREFVEDGMLSPGRVADALRTTRAEVADTLGLRRDALSRASSVRARKTQTRLRELLEILYRVKAGTGVGDLAAYAWFRAEPLAGFDDRTAASLVRQGRAGCVHAYLDDVAEQTGWVLYVEGSTDLSILVAFARRLKHERALRALERPFVYYVGNHPRAAQNHYHGLREALPELRGAAIFDRLDAPPDMAPIECLMWTRREIENYVCTRAALEAYAADSASGAGPGPLFAEAEADRRVRAMRESIAEIESALKTLGKGSPWGADVKASDEFLDPLFQAYFARIGLSNLMAEKNYHELADCVPDGEIDPEVGAKLDAIARVAEAAASGAGGLGR